MLRTVRERGPIRAADVATPVRKPGNPWFNWSEGKIALDYLFFAGRVCAAHRVSFERRYDLPERVLPEPSSTPRPRPRTRRSASCC